MEIRTVASREAPGELGLRSHPKDYQQKINILIRSPTQKLTENDKVKVISIRSRFCIFSFVKKSTKKLS